MNGTLNQVQMSVTTNGFEPESVVNKRLLHVSHRSSCGIELIALSGPVDSENIETFVRVVSLLSEMRPTRAIIDFRGLTYMNIQALQTLRKYRRSISLKSGVLASVGLNADLVKSHKKFIEENPKLFGQTIDDALAELRPLLAA